MNETIDRRLEDSQGSIGRIVDSKLQASMRELSEDVNTRMRDSISGLWTKTSTQINDTDEATKRAFEVKMETSMQDLIS